MKTKRFVSTLLALLLVCSLPVSAFAEDNSADIFLNTGTVNTNYAAIDTNHGVVEINEGGIDTNSADGEYPGTVETNYGTVNKLEYDREVSKWVIDETWYGVQVDNDGETTLEQKKAGDVLDLTQFTKEGYVYAGYTQEYQLLNGVLTKQALTVSDTSYTVTCPNVLTLIWQAIFSPAADDGTGSFGPGSFVSINGHKFLLVAVVEDVYCLASVDSFGEEQLSDLPALLASLLTEEQLTHVTGEPELLDEELTAHFFGGRGSHIVFPCDSSLIFS